MKMIGRCCDWLVKLQWWKLLLIAIVFRLPSLIALFPGRMICDTGSAIAQFYGFSTHVVQVSATPDAILSNHHMILFTFLMGGAVKLGEMMGNQNLGYFLYTILQVILTNAVFVYGICVLRRKASKWVTALAYLYEILLPIVSLWQVTVCKDSLFAVAFLLWLILLYQIVESRGEKLKSVRFDLFLLLSNCLVIFTKAQGAYLSVVTFVVIALVYRRQILRVLLAGVLPAVFYLTIFTGIILPSAGVAVSGKQEMFGFMFQQTAKYVVEYADEVTEEEAAVIDAILPYDQLAELYNPNNQDDVKFEYKQTATDEDLHAYFSTWFKMFWKHPDAYVEATLLNVRYFFLPQPYDGFIYSYMPVRLELSNILKEHQVFTLYNVKPYPIYNVIATGLDLCVHIPMVRTVFFQTWPFVWLAVVLSLLTALRTRGRALLYMLPVVLSVLVLLITPVADLRYVLMFVYSFPFWAMALSQRSSSSVETESLRKTKKRCPQ